MWPFKRKENWDLIGIWAGKWETEESGFQSKNVFWIYYDYPKFKIVWGWYTMKGEIPIEHRSDPKKFISNFLKDLKEDLNNMVW